MPGSASRASASIDRGRVLAHLGQRPAHSDSQGGRSTGPPTRRSSRPSRKSAASVGRPMQQAAVVHVTSGTQADIVPGGSPHRGRALECGPLHRPPKLPSTPSTDSSLEVPEMPRNRARRAAAGHLDRRQGVDDPEARGGGPRSRRSRAPRSCCFQELFYGPYFCQVQEPAVLQLHGAHPRRAHDHRACRTSPSRPGMVLVVPMYEEDEHASGHLLQHRRRHRRRRHVPRQVPQDPHPARQGLLGEVLLPARQPRLPGLRDGGRARSASTSATTATSPRAPARSD